MNWNISFLSFQTYDEMKVQQGEEELGRFK